MKRHKETDWPSLAKYVAGECSPEEEAALKAWMAEDASRTALVGELRRVWSTTRRRATPRDVEAAWRAVDARLTSTDPAASRRNGRAPHAPARPPRRRTRTGRRRPLPRVAAVLAVVAAAVLLPLLLLETPLSEVASATVRVFTTEEGQQAVIRLTDGTRVHLNVDSRLVLSEAFTTGRRRVVHLKGEAYFEVARDTTRPFLVRAKGATVRVLGTAFDVRAYADEDAVQVAVAEGEVALHPDGTAQRDTAVVLHPRTLGVIADRRVQAVHREVDLTHTLAWIDGCLVFEDASFGEVVRQLERWYALRVELSVPPAAVDRLNATFDDESLDEVLAAIATALDLQYQKDRQTVVFFREGPARSAGYARPAR